MTNPVVSRIGERGVRWMARTAPGWTPAIAVIGWSEREARSRWRSSIGKWARLGLRLTPLAAASGVVPEPTDEPEEQRP